MASRDDVNALAGLNSSIRALVIRDLNAFWATLNLATPEVARDRLLEFLPVLVAQYGDVAATVSADWYSQIREAAGAPGRFRPLLAENTATARVEGTTRRLAEHLFSDQPTKMLDGLVGAISEYALQPGRETLVRSSVRDPWRPRVARVPTGATTCAFCLVLASRGPVYGSVASAGQLVKFHAHDDCQIVVIGPKESLPEGYDPVALRSQYNDARRAAGSSTLAGDSTDHLSILQALRRSDAPNVADAVHTHDH